MRIRRLCVTILSIMIIVAGVIVIYQAKSSQEEFKIISTLKSSFGNEKTCVDISVIVNTDDYEVEEMFTKVHAYYCDLNGEPEELHIKLYESQKSYEKAELLAEKNYIKD